ncbi:unnamed protein product, partial [Didymodactylos carnosus]
FSDILVYTNDLDMSSSDEILELVKKLKRESSFVNAEKKQLIELFSQILKLAERLSQTTWIAQQQRLVLTSLIYTNRVGDLQILPQTCCQRLEQSKFIDSYRYFHYNHSDHYIKFLNYLRQSPHLLAICLTIIERIDSSLMNQIIPILMCSLYGQCIYLQDEYSVLNILKSLCDIQLKNENNPRITVQRSSSAFKLVFDSFLTSLQSSKIFLTASLHEPIMQLVMQDDWYYDINPDISMNRFSKQERLRRFGQPGTRDYLDKVQKYRDLIVHKLYSFTSAFIDSIKNSMFYFPVSLSCIISQICTILSQTGDISTKEIRSLCCDIIMTLFIGPAICEPEKHGIIADVPISSVARHNLNQIGIILQTLAMANDVENKAKDLYSKFKESDNSNTNCVSSILDNLIDSSANVAFSIRSVTSSTSSSSQSVSRSVLLITQKQLQQLVKRCVLFARRASAEMNQTQHSELKQQLETYLKELVPLEECVKSEYMNYQQSNNDQQIVTSTIASDQQSHTIHHNNHHHHKHHKIKITGKDNINSANNSSKHSERLSHDSLLSQEAFLQTEQVIVFTIDSNETECPGMLSEEKILLENETKLIKSSNTTLEYDPSATEKRLRFLLKDNNSVGNISDNLEGLEGISEGAPSTGNLSVTSSCDDLDKAQNEMETDAIFDNVSVSGRATPNLSGRDTPSSHISLDSSQQQQQQQNSNISQDSVTSNSNLLSHHTQSGSPSTISNSQNTNALNQQHSIPRGPTAIPVTVEKPFRQDVPEKFHNFDLPQQNDVDETRSTLSDNWSMVPGLSEYGDPQEQISRLNEIIEELPIAQELIFPESNAMSCNAIKPVDQQSDCWSTEAFASDSETHSEDGHQQQTSLSKINLSSSTMNDSIGDANSSQIVDDTIIVHTKHQQDPQTKTATITTVTITKRTTTTAPTHSMRTNSIADPVDIMLMKSSLESISSATDSGILDSTKTSLLSPSISATPTTILKPTTIENKQKLINVQLSTSLNNLVSFDQNQNNIIANPMMLTTNIETPTYEHSISSSSSSSLSQFFGQTQLTSPTIEKKESMASAATMSNHISNSQGKQTSSKSNEKSRSSNLSNTFRRFGGRFNSKSRDRDRSGVIILADDQQLTQTQQSEGNISADDILSKYATNKSQQQPNSMNSTTTTVKLNGNTDDYVMEKRDTITNELTNETIDTSSYYDPSNFDTCKAFVDAKKKLRYILSLVDIDCCSFSSYMTTSIVARRNSSASSSSLSMNGSKQNNLVLFLRSQLYEAISMQDRDLQSQLYETLRFVQQFSEIECKEILRSMGDDYRSRTVYIAYLVKNIENLLNSTQHQEKLLLRVQRDQDLCKQHIINYLAKLYLDSDVRERRLLEFIEQFQHLSIGHEKMHLVELFLDKCNRDLLSDINWRTASPEQIQMSHIAIERMVMSNIYTQALYPNGQVDVQRDQVFSSHITRLAEQIGPNHQKLRIQKIFQRECPWPSAQAELILINAYKTPRDKVGCVQRCIRIIQNLIRLSSNSAASADDTIPILIFVIIKANPPNLLSNLQYVQDLYSSRLTNEESYYWTMFVSAVRFICELIN